MENNELIQGQSKEETGLVSEMQNHSDNSEMNSSAESHSYSTEAIEHNDKENIPKEETKITQNNEAILAEEDEEEEMVFMSEDELHSLSKKELIEQLKRYVEYDDLKKVKTIIGLIRSVFTQKVKNEQKEALDKFIENGGKREEFQPPIDPLNEEFNKVFAIYKERKQRQQEEQEKQLQENLKQKKEILEEMKRILESSEILKKTYDDFRELQTKWRSIGPVPPSETSDLWNSYHFYVEKFFERVKQNEELKDLDLRKNLEKKLQICEKIEELILEPSINKSRQLLQHYKKEWQETGPVPYDKKDEIWERFILGIEKIKQKIREFYEKRREQQENNLKLKTALCERVEQINELTLNTPAEYEEKRREIENIQAEWKTIGFAPKEANDEIWKRFKTALDIFYNNRNEFYKKLKNERLENLNRKIAICVQAEALRDSTDWKKTTEEFLKLQEEWKKIGPVPQSQADKIWKRFRESCDYFFNRKAEYFKNLEEIQAKNLQLKKELIEKVENYVFGDDNEQNLSLLKDFQRQWMEIGHVPAKEKDELYRRFRAAIDKHLENLKINATLISTFRYKEKLQNLSNSQDRNKKINQEKNFLINKINSLKNDITIWENNINFLSNSKNSEILKQEYLKRIDATKEKIKEYEEKLKMLNQISNSNNQ